MPRAPVRTRSSSASRWSGRCGGRAAPASGFSTLYERRAVGTPLADGVIVTNPGQAQFGIVQGGVSPELREESARGTVAIGFEAYAIGGLSVGEPTDVMYDIVARTTPCLPEDRPRYLMGAGTPQDLVESVARGVDLFDCVLPTRNARNGQLFTSEGPHQYQERAVRGGRPAARSGVPLLHLPDLFARVSAASFSGRRDQRVHP